MRAWLLALSLPAVAVAGPVAPKFNASSAQGSHGAASAFDGLLSTAWVEDKPGQGVGEWLEVDLGADTAVRTVTVWGGHFGSRDDWRDHHRVAEVTLSGTGPEGAWKVGAVLGDRFASKTIAVDKTTRTLRVTVDRAYDGAVRDELHIAEIAFDFDEKPDPAWEEAIGKAVAKSKTTRDLPTQWPAALDAAYAACKARESYNKNFEIIGLAAVRGPEWRLPFVQQLVPVGRRLSALQFDEAAVEMLGRLKDPNAIAYLEVAAAGARREKDRQWLEESVRVFAAYAELMRAPRTSVPNWGSTGMEKGAFRGRGEPLALATDSQGNVWVADTGNNRVQRLTAAGSPDLVIGGAEKGVATRWFGEEGEPYATAAMPGAGPTEFQQPIDLDVGNYDILAVVDADLRVRTFNADGTPKAQWELPSVWRPTAGQGVSSPIVTWKGDDFYFIVRDEVFVYTADGAQKASFHLEGGPAQSAVIGAGGKLLVRHAGEKSLTEYKAEDGFKLGAWIKKGLPDDGAEDWDLCSDADDSVYIVTDAGFVYKFNKKGKFIKQYQVFENAKDLVRVAAFSNLILVSAKDAIARVEQEE